MLFQHTSFLLFSVLLGLVVVPHLTLGNEFDGMTQEAGSALRRNWNSNPCTYPDLIALPDGFKPEGIVSGKGADFYVGSLKDGSIFKGDYCTGTGSVWFTPTAGQQQAAGLSYDWRTKYLFVAGGTSGNVRVLDTTTATEVSVIDVAGSILINDVIVTLDGAYLTEFFAPALYKIPLTFLGGLTSDPTITLPLTGDFTFVPGGFNANGIEATLFGNSLLVVNSDAGELYKVDPATGDAELVDLGGASVFSADGILLVGRKLYVVRNFLNQIDVIDLASDYLSGTVTNVLTNTDFQIPTTITRYGWKLYVVNGRFDVAPPTEPTADGISFNVVKVN